MSPVSKDLLRNRGRDLELSLEDQVRKDLGLKTSGSVVSALAKALDLEDPEGDQVPDGQLIHEGEVW
jgi:hypothetical protein